MSTALSVAECDDDAAAEQEQRAWQALIRLRAVARGSEPRNPRLPRLAALAFVALLHVLLLIAVHVAMRPESSTLVVPVQVRIISEAAEPSLPEPAPLLVHAPHATRAATRAVPLPPQDVSPDPREIAPATNEPPLHLFNPDGSIALPAPRADAITATFTAQPPAADLRIMQHQRPLKVRPNHFAQNFRAQSGTALDDFIADHLTFEKEFTLPWGTHVKCGAVFLFVAAGGGCGWETPYRYYVPTGRWQPASVLDEQ